jgi:hypothetical protein
MSAIGKFPEFFGAGATGVKPKPKPFRDDFIPGVHGDAHIAVII